MLGIFKLKFMNFESKWDLFSIIGNSTGKFSPLVFGHFPLYNDRKKVSLDN